MRHRFAIVVIAALHAAALGAQQMPNCKAAEHRQFDFWLGRWNVEGKAGKQAGKNSITSTNSGCVIEERWEGAGGITGTSLNHYDTTSKQWRQTWLDNSGGRLDLAGGLEGKSMRMSGTQLDAEGKKTLERVTWTPNDDGTVRQLWESSADAGKTWTVVFDGLYRKAKE